jgi:hypothetical protein
MLKKVMLVVALAALLVPAAALANSIEVEGPAELAGRGGVRGALHGAEPATVELRLRGGQIRVTGAAADLEVACTGRRVKQASRTHRQLKTVLCRARGRMLVAITSKRFRFAAQSRRFTIQIPEGLSGVLHGNVRAPEAPAEEQQPAEEQPVDAAPDTESSDS